MALEGLFGDSALQEEPGIGFREGSVVLPDWPDPRWVPDLEVETASGEDLGKVQFPVEEGLSFGDCLYVGEPRVCGHEGHGVLHGELWDVELFDDTELIEARVVIESHISIRRHVLLLAPLALALWRNSEGIFKEDQPLLPVRQFVNLVQGPEGQGAPGVHNQAETLVHGLRVTEAVLDLRTGHSGGFGAQRLGHVPDVQVAAGGLLAGLEALGGDRPQGLCACGERLEALLLAWAAGVGGLAVGTDSLDEGPSCGRTAQHGLAPALHRCRLLGGELLGLLGISNRAPSLGRQQEVMHLPHRQVAGRDVSQAPLSGCHLPDLLLSSPCLTQVVDGAARPDKGVTAFEMQAEPGRRHTRLHDVEPHGDLRKLHGGGVEIHPVDPVQGDPGLHLTTLAGQVLGLNPLLHLTLAALQVGVGQLIDGLVGEGTGTQCWFAYPEGEDFLSGGVLGEELCQGVSHHALREHLGRVVGGGALPVPAGQAECELASPVAADALLARGRIGEADDV